MNQLEQLKKFTTVVADTGDFQSIKAYTPRDATTNPSLILKAVQKDEYKPLLEKIVKEHPNAPTGEVIDRLLIAFGLEILQIIPGRVSTEVDARLSFDTEATVAKGRELIGSPKWKFTLSGEYARPINDRLEGYLQMDGVYSSSISYSAAYDPLDATGSHFLLGGRLGLRTKDGKYGVAIYARNLTDERAPNFVISTPVAQPSGGLPLLNDANSHSQYFGPDSFRTVGVSLDARF